MGERQNRRGSGYTIEITSFGGGSFLGSDQVEGVVVGVVTEVEEQVEEGPWSRGS